MTPAEHVVSFTAEDGALIARCSCGWFHRWRPFSDKPSSHYSLILSYGLEHTLKFSQPLPERPDEP